jgi:pyruvate formate lyase activating enzyme
MTGGDVLWRPADFWSQDQRGRLWCQLCPFHCSFDSDDLGRCRVRRRRGDQLETSTFALPVRHRQPIERKPFYHVRPGAMTLTLAAPGCNFRCDYCQNSSLAHAEPDEPGLPEIPAASLSAAVETAIRDGLILALSFTEPTLAAEATLALHHLAAGRVPIVWKTNGFISPGAIERLAPALTAVNIDLKAANLESHLRLTEAPLAPVVKAMHAFAAAQVWVEISTTLVPGVNDDTHAVATMADIVAGVGLDTPWHLRRFHPDHQRQHTIPTSSDTLSRAARIARDAGLRHVYVERALGAEGCMTTCPTCNDKLILRRFGRLQENRMQDGRCLNCGATLPGRW